MKFYSEIKGNLTVKTPNGFVRFKNGECETDNNVEIEALKKAGYKQDEEEKEITKKEIIAELEEKGIEHNPRAKKADLLALLKEG